MWTLARDDHERGAGTGGGAAPPRSGETAGRGTVTPRRRRSRSSECLDALVEPLSRGDPGSPLRWSSKSTRSLAGELTAAGHPISQETVAQMLRQLDYSLQGTRKTEKGV